jgi:hypothetical protein
MCGTWVSGRGERRAALAALLLLGAAAAVRAALAALLLLGAGAAER